MQVAYGIQNREVLGIVLEDFFVLSDGVLQLALLDVLLGRAEDLRFVEA